MRNEKEIEVADFDNNLIETQPVPEKIKGEPVEINTFKYDKQTMRKIIQTNLNLNAEKSTTRLQLNGGNSNKEKEEEKKENTNFIGKLLNSIKLK